MLQILKNPYILRAFLYDLMVVSVAFLLSLALRFEIFDPLALPVESLQMVFFISIAVQAVCLYHSGLYQGVWKFSSIPDLTRVIKGSTLAVVCSVIVLFLYNRLETIPRATFFINWVLLIIGLGGGRFGYRLWKDEIQRKGYFFDKLHHKQITNTLIIGAGNAGVQLVKDIKSNPEVDFHIVGLIDDNPLYQGRTIMGVKVLGGREDIGTWVKKYRVEKVFIAVPSCTGKQLREIIDECEKCQVAFKTLPHFSEMLNDKVKTSLLRDVKFEDLLRRGPVKLDTHSIEQMIVGKTIMVTGAGGSIGSELCRKIARFRPKRLICFELSEFFLYELELELKEAFDQLDFVPVIGDVRSRSKVASVFQQYRPEVILHAAAYKHVPMMELNPMEAVITNILGTLTVAEQAKNYCAEKFVMVSTDKAVNPTSIMGCSKKIAEMVCQYIGNQAEKTQYITVRFGNVIGSNGSIIPLFKRQIEKRQDMTVTHPDIERYFMSISEASELILQAATMGKENQIFVLNMGEPIKIVELAKEMIVLAGLEQGRDINIKFIGLRPGEKLYEELFTQKENLGETPHEKVYVAKVQNLPWGFAELLSELTSLNIDSGKIAVVRNFRKLVPEFQGEEFNLEGMEIPQTSEASKVAT